MPRDWTDAQKAAIYEENADILVSAAAGSGKTAVLVERVIQKITRKENPVDVDRLLVVTFTNAAAAEMRQRINDALTEKLEVNPGDEALLRQSSLLPQASITTIHAFCHKILRSNFQLAGLDPNFRIADPTETELLRLSALEEVIEEMYEDNRCGESFLKLTEAYLDIKNAESFYQLINSIFDFSMSLPEPLKWLQDAAERFNAENDSSPNDGCYVKALILAGKKEIRKLMTKYDAMLTMADSDDGGEGLFSFLMTEKELLSSLCNSESYDEFYHRAKSFTFERVPSVPKGAQPLFRKDILELRDEVKKTYKDKLLKELFCCDACQQSRRLREFYPVACALSETVKRLIFKFDEKKSEKNLLDYNDLEHHCYKLLTGNDKEERMLSESVREQFDEILIDEYQDTSALQEAIFNAIKKEKATFLVGDVKQSIYRFRNTNPKLFMGKKERFSEVKGAEEHKIILSHNFRSREGILDSVNYIFERIMSKEIGEINYNEEEELNKGNDYPACEKPLTPAVELCLTDLGEFEDDASEAPEAITAEAIMAARKIQSLIDGGYQVLGKDGMRRIDYRDICILMRSTKGYADSFAKTLADFGIPCYSDVGGSFLQSEEINVIMSLLKIIDNPHQDIPLLTVLRSQLYALTADELAEIRLADRKGDFYSALIKRSEKEDKFGERLQRFLKDLVLWRRKSRQLPTGELVWYLYMQTGLYDAQATLKGGTLRRLNLRLLYTRAVDYEKTGLKGLYSFIRFIDEFQSVGGDYDAARTIGEEQNVVRIMSIHKSKGLEFPVVILSGIGRKFNLRDLQKPVLIHGDLGYGPKLIDTDLGIVYNNCARSVVKQILHAETLSEELRILYVAMTRAREKLVFLSAGKNLVKKIKKCSVGARQNPVSSGNVSEAACYLDWILTALLRHPAAKTLAEYAGLELSFNPEVKGEFQVILQDPNDLIVDEETVKASAFTDDEEKASMDLSFLFTDDYLYADETSLPAKITVTEVKRRLQEESDSVYLYPVPAFLKTGKSGLSAAERGTAVHSVLERICLDEIHSESDVASFVSDLEQQGVLTAEEKASIPVSHIFSFCQSEIGERLKKADVVKRELSFGIYVDAEKIFGQKGQIMMQGIIDCVFFEGDSFSILDYKTDQGDSPEKIAEKYKIQLDCYQEAAEKIYGKKVSHRYIYLVYYNKTIEI